MLINEIFKLCLQVLLALRRCKLCLNSQSCVLLPMEIVCFIFLGSVFWVVSANVPSATAVPTKIETNPNIYSHM
jgi:hypothetical protein